ncbi:hypothetical protein [Curvivirga sp.]|uniref:hypothetical protein n=1 Tax=Curvivirga sp. TaxID=2856848 RepID=UPI003B58EE5B
MSGWSSQNTAPVEEVTEKYLPNSLEDRGLALPFTTRPVAYARLRQGKKGLEVILPGFADKLVANVLPFDKLPELVSLTVFDRALHEAITNLIQGDKDEDSSSDKLVETLNSSTIRQLRMEIGETGLGGIDMMRIARSKRVIFANMEPAILNALADDLIQKHGSNNAPEHVNMATDEGRNTAALELERFAETHGLQKETILERLSDISQVMRDFGGPHTGMNGPVRDILSRMQSFSDDLRQWLIPEPVEESEMAQLTSIAALATIKAAEKYVEDLDLVYKNLDQSVLQWDKLRDNIIKIRDALDLMIDGWERILDSREYHINAQRFRQRECLAALAPFVPVLPKPIITDEKEKENWLKLRTAQLRWLGRVKYLKDMKDGAEAALRNTKMEIL